MNDNTTPLSVLLPLYDFNPRPKGRPRMTKSGHVYTSKSDKEQERYIARAFKEMLESHNYLKAPDFLAEFQDYDEPFTMDIHIASKKKRGDLDNIAKSVLDALNGVAYADDKQLRSLSIYHNPIKGGTRDITFVFIGYDNPQSLSFK